MGDIKVVAFDFGRKGDDHHIIDFNGMFVNFDDEVSAADGIVMAGVLDIEDILRCWLGVFDDTFACIGVAVGQFAGESPFEVFVLGGHHKVAGTFFACLEVEGAFAVAYSHLVVGKYFADFGSVVDRSEDIGYGAGKVDLGGCAIGDFELGTTLEPLVFERRRDAVSGPAFGDIVVTYQLYAVGRHFAYAFVSAYKSFLVGDVYQTVICVIGNVATGLHLDVRIYFSGQIDGALTFKVA